MTINVDELIKIDERLRFFGYKKKVRGTIAVLKVKNIQSISLLDLSEEFLKLYPNDRTTSVKELAFAAMDAGIKVTDCAWSMD